MRLWWSEGGCELEAPADGVTGVHVTIDASGASTLRDLGRPSPTRGEEPFTGLRDRVEIAAAMVRPEIIDAARLPDGRVAALLDDGGKASLGIAARLLDGASWPDALVLATKGSRSVAWPKGLLWSKKAPRSRARKMSTKRGELCLRAAAGALAVTCQYTGIAAIFRDGSATPTLLRLPMGPGVRLHAVPTALGVLITVATDDGAGAVIHVDDDGTILGQRAVHAPLPALPTADRRAVLFVGDETGGSGRLHLLRLPDLAAEGPSVHIGFPAKSLALAENGRIALADPERLVRGILGEDGLTLGAVEDLVTLIAASGEGSQAVSANPELAQPTRVAEAPAPAVEPESAAGAEAETRAPADDSVEAARAKEGSRAAAGTDLPGSQDAQAVTASEPDGAAPAVRSDVTEDEVTHGSATEATSSAEVEADAATPSSSDAAPQGSTSEATSVAAAGADDENPTEVEPRVSEDAGEAAAPDADANPEAEARADDESATDRGSPVSEVAGEAAAPEADANPDAEVRADAEAATDDGPPAAAVAQADGDAQTDVEARADGDASDSSRGDAEASADDDAEASAGSSSEGDVEATAA
ncbi:MAG: hypothetical protein KC486_29450, partial [Myxococcales bacterium]|nr:hypothetical protein [Myxococcales bacterium]